MLGKLKSLKHRILYEKVLLNWRWSCIDDFGKGDLLDESSFVCWIRITKIVRLWRTTYRVEVPGYSHESPDLSAEICAAFMCTNDAGARYQRLEERLKQKHLWEQL